VADGLDRAVLRAGEDLKPRPQPPDGLMVCTVDRAARAVQLAQKARRGVDDMQPVNAVNLTVALDVLTQRAVKIDVEDLQSAADADDRLSRAQEVVNQRRVLRRDLPSRSALDHKSAGACRPRRAAAKRPRSPAFRRAAHRPARAHLRNFSGVPINRQSSYAQNMPRMRKKTLQDAKSYGIIVWLITAN
jgi:hypothetical protein